MADAIESTPVSVVVPVPLDARALLARVNRRIVDAKRAIRHRHDDEPFWQALGTTAREEQRARAYSRHVADLLHVERATQRGRIHGARFATLDEQRAWLQSKEAWSFDAGLSVATTLARLRAGEVLDETG